MNVHNATVSNMTMNNINTVVFQWHTISQLAHTVNPDPHLLVVLWTQSTLKPQRCSRFKTSSYFEFFKGQNVQIMPNSIYHLVNKRAKFQNDIAGNFIVLLQKQKEPSVLAWVKVSFQSAINGPEQGKSVIDKWVTSQVIGVQRWSALSNITTITFSC